MAPAIQIPTTNEAPVPLLLRTGAPLKYSQGFMVKVYIWLTSFELYLECQSFSGSPIFIMFSLCFDNWGFIDLYRVLLQEIKEL